MVMLLTPEWRFFALKGSDVSIQRLRVAGTVVVRQRRIPDHLAVTAKAPNHLHRVFEFITKHVRAVVLVILKSMFFPNPLERVISFPLASAGFLEAAHNLQKCSVVWFERKHASDLGIQVHADGVRLHILTQCGAVAAIAAASSSNVMLLRGPIEM